MPADKKREKRAAKLGPATDAPDLERAKAAVATAQEGGAEAVAAALSDLVLLPPGIVAAVLGSLAHGDPESALPLLLHMTERAPKPQAIAAIEALGAVRMREAGTALQRLATGAADRDVRKAAKRSLFRLQTAGVALPETPAEAPRVDVNEVLAAKITNPDGAGSRFLILATGASLGTADLIALVVSDEVGLVNGGGTRVARSELPRRTEQFFQETEGLHLVDAPADYLRQVVQEAHARNRASGQPVPEEYYRWSGTIGSPQRQYEREPIYDEVDSALIRWSPQLLDESGVLFQLPEFSGWLIPPEAAQAAVSNLARTRQTRLVLPGESEERPELRAVERLAEEFFTDVQRLKYKRRLEQAAYVLVRLGHVLAARRALAAALALDPASYTRPSSHPFAVAMALHTLQYLQAESERQRVRSGRLILPG